MIKHSVSSRQMRHEFASRFEAIRDLLLTDRFAEQLRRPLSHWTLPADRRLPRALLDRTLGDLLRTPFASLEATPGIGRRKIQSLLKLLDRALRTDDLRRERLEGETTTSSVTPIAPLPRPSAGPDPANISEVTWATWRATIVAHGLADEPIGCFAASLSELPRALWTVPLRHYAGLTLAEIRRLKTHGEKRVRCVVKIFGQLHAQLDGKPTDGRSNVRLTSENVDSIEAWTRRKLASVDLPSLEEISAHFVEPLIRQIAADAGQASATMLRGRLGIEGPALSVRKTAMRLRLTRARIYQLLDDAGTVVEVRWPRGKVLIRSLLERFASTTGDSPEHRFLKAAAEALFPAEFRTVREPIPAFVRRFQSSAERATGAVLSPERSVPAVDPSLIGR